MLMDTYFVGLLLLVSLVAASQHYSSDSDISVLEDCDCGNGVCQLDPQTSLKTCQCYNGYQSFEGYCKECNCSEHGSCEFDDNGYRKCTCNAGYAEKSGTCKRCDCGDNGRCSFHFYDGRKLCQCNGDYLNVGGSCHRCHCGVHGRCLLRKDGTIECACDQGFEYFNGSCEESGSDECEYFECYPGFCTKYNDTAICLCPEDYVSFGINCVEIRNGTCAAVKCFPGICRKDDENEMCWCPPNYTSTGLRCVETSSLIKPDGISQLIWIVVGTAILLVIVFSVCLCIAVKRRVSHLV